MDTTKTKTAPAKATTSARASNSARKTSRSPNNFIVGRPRPEHKGREMANHLSIEKKRMIIAALVEGNSIRSIERMVGTHRDTIMRLLVRVGEHCQEIMDEKMVDVECADIQADEIWTYVGKKQRRLTDDERANRRDLGDQYVFVALDRKTKLVPVFRIGKRNGYTARAFIADLEDRLRNVHPQISTDGFEAYVDAIELAFGDDVDYGQVIKVYASEYAGRGRYSPPSVSETIKKTVQGNPDEDKICTSHVERQNLTMRMQMRRFTRLTNAFSKKLENLKAALALHFAHYNFCRVHQTLRVTPAMEAGITDRLWGLGDLLAAEA